MNGFVKAAVFTAMFALFASAAQPVLFGFTGHVANPGSGPGDLQVNVSINASCASGPGIIYSEKFAGAVMADGTFGVTLGKSKLLMADYGKSYWLCAGVDGVRLGNATEFNTGQGEIGNITAAGNITINPTGRLVVNGALAVGGSTGAMAEANVPQLLGGLRAPNAGELRFGNGGGWLFHISKASDYGATRFVTIKDNGMVGINTTPTRTLDVKGNMGIIGGNNLPVLTLYSIANNTRYGFIEWRNGTGTRGAYLGYGSSTTPAHLDLVLENNNNLYISGRVGIGTSVPGALLSVSGNLSVSDNATFSKNLSVDGTTMFVDSNANRVGINTGSPSQALEVQGNVQAGTDIVSSAGIYLRRKSGATVAMSQEFIPAQNSPTYSKIWGGNFTSENSGSAITANAWYMTAAPAAAKLVFGTINASGAFTAANMVPRLVLASTGVGIGTATPKTALDVAGTIRSTAQTVPTSGAGVEIIYHAEQGYLTAYNRTNSTYRPMNVYGDPVLLNPLGGRNVGIGTATPTDALTVAGAGNFSRGIKVPVSPASTACAGTVTLKAGGANIATTCASPTALVFVTAQNRGGTPGAIQATGKATGRFDLNSTSANDTSTVAWFIVNGAP